MSDPIWRPRMRTAAVGCVTWIIILGALYFIWSL